MRPSRRREPQTKSPARAKGNSPGQARLCERAAPGKNTQTQPHFSKPRESASLICGFPDDLEMYFKNPNLFCALILGQKFVSNEQLFTLQEESSTTSFDTLRGNSGCKICRIPGGFANGEHLVLRGELVMSREMQIFGVHNLNWLTVFGI